jgi:hypothetical protein
MEVESVNRTVSRLIGFSFHFHSLRAGARKILSLMRDRILS